MKFLIWWKQKVNGWAIWKQTPVSYLQDMSEIRDSIIMNMYCIILIFVEKLTDKGRLLFRMINSGDSLLCIGNWNLPLYLKTM